MSAHNVDAQRKTPINNSAIKALRHLLNALYSLQKTESATDTAVLVARIYADSIEVELERLGGRRQ